MSKAKVLLGDIEEKAKLEPTELKLAEIVDDMTGLVVGLQSLSKKIPKLPPKYMSVIRGLEAHIYHVKTDIDSINKLLK